MTFRLQGLYRCDWVRENNGAIQVKWAPGRIDAGTGDHPLLTDITREHGVPEVGQVYQVSFQPAFPHHDRDA